MGIISGSVLFRGRFGDHFRVGDHFGVDLGIISGAVQYPQSNEHQDTVQDAEVHRVNSVNRMQYGRSIN